MLNFLSNITSQFDCQAIELINDDVEVSGHVKLTCALM